MDLVSLTEKGKNEGFEMTQCLRASVVIDRIADRYSVQSWWISLLRWLTNRSIRSSKSSRKDLAISRQSIKLSQGPTTFHVFRTEHVCCFDVRQLGLQQPNTDSDRQFRPLQGHERGTREPQQMLRVPIRVLLLLDKTFGGSLPKTFVRLI